MSWWRLGARGNGRLRVGDNSIVHCRVDFDHLEGYIKIGDRSYVGICHIVCRTGIVIGDDVLISWDVTIVDHDSHAVNWEHRKNDVANWMQGKKDWANIATAPVTIGNKSWIGFGASILKGVTIGEGAIVGARSVVTRDVAPYTVVAGNPARVIKTLTPAVLQVSPLDHPNPTGAFHD